MDWAKSEALAKGDPTGCGQYESGRNDGRTCFEEATQRFRELGGDRVRIEFGPRSEDRYGRALFYVYTEAGESVAEKLIREGLGKAWERDGQHRELLMAVEDGAERSGNRGLC